MTRIADDQQKKITNLKFDALRNAIYHTARRGIMDALNKIFLFVVIVYLRCCGGGRSRAKVRHHSAVACFCSCYGWHYSVGCGFWCGRPKPRIFAAAVLRINR